MISAFKVVIWLAALYAGCAIVGAVVVLAHHGWRP